MRKVRKGLFVTLSGMIIVLLAAGTAWAQSASAKASASAAPSGTAGGTFIEGTINDMRTVNPWKAIESPEYEVLALNFDLLENFDKSTLQASPGVATSWTQSPDGLTWTFNIRQGMTWQDGQPFTANDIAFTYNKTLDCNLGNSLDYLVPDFTDVDHRAEPDAARVDDEQADERADPAAVGLHRPRAHLGQVRRVTTSRRRRSSKTASRWSAAAPSSSREWNKGQDWTMTANPNYWGGAPHISQFKVVLYDNSEAMVNALKQGEIDYTNLGSVDLFNQLQSAGGAGRHHHPRRPGRDVRSDELQHVRPDVADAAPYCKNNPGSGNPALRDPAVRTAISWAIDRQTIVDKVLAGYGEPGTTIVPPFASFYHYQPTADETIGFNIDKAKQILDDAGYKDTDNNGIRNDPKTGQDLNFRLILRSESDIGARLGTYVSGWLKQIGIATTSEVVGDGKLGRPGSPTTTTCTSGAGAPTRTRTSSCRRSRRASAARGATPATPTPQYDKLYKEQQTAPNPQARKRSCIQMQQMLYKDIPEVVLYYDKSLEAYNSAKWTGLEDNTSPQPDGFLWNQYTPYSALTVQLRARTRARAAASSSSLLVIVGILGAIIVVVGDRHDRPHGASPTRTWPRPAPRDVRTTQDGNGEVPAGEDSVSCSSPSCSSCLSRSSCSGFGNPATRSPRSRRRPARIARRRSSTRSGTSGAWTSRCRSSTSRYMKADADVQLRRLHDPEPAARASAACSGRGWLKSAVLITTATLASIAIGVLLGIYGGWKRQGAVDQGSMGASMVLYAMPEFVLGMIFILIFAGALHWFPVNRYESAIPTTGLRALDRRGQPHGAAVAHADPRLRRRVLPGDAELAARRAWVRNTSPWRAPRVCARSTSCASTRCPTRCCPRSRWSRCRSGSS